MTFTDLNLSPPLLEVLTHKGYKNPSPIQQKAIPVILQGRDVMAAAQTGTGKTAGFTLPMLEQLSQQGKVKPNHIRALILTPTRELAAQVEDSVATYGQFLPLRSAAVFGGVKINPQMMKLRKGVDILVATPGRLMDLYQQNAVRFGQVSMLVLDEADRMLDMGFINDIRKILALLPQQRQNLLFSATFSNDIRQLAKSLLKDPVEISVSPANTTAATVKQWFCPVDKKRKPELLASLISQHRWQQVLVFTRTKHGANKLTTFLNHWNIKSIAIHGNKSQGARTRALAAFKAREVSVLVATDIAARGLDIEQLPQVVNFDLPNIAEDYVHRIGRTGRAGSEGQAISLVSADEHEYLQGIERLIKQRLTRQYVDDFQPEHDVPETGSPHRPAKKPKKPKTKRNPSKRQPTSDKPHSNHKPKNGQRQIRKNAGNKSQHSKGNKSR